MPWCSDEQPAQASRDGRHRIAPYVFDVFERTCADGAQSVLDGLDAPLDALRAVLAAMGAIVSVRAEVRPAAVLADAPMRVHARRVRQVRRLRAGAGRAARARGVI